MKSLKRFILISCFSLLAACGSDDDEGSIFDSSAASGSAAAISAAAITGNVSISVSGLAGSLWLTLNDELLSQIITSGTYPAPVTFATGDSYDLRVFNQPDGQYCSITNGSGNHPGTTLVINVVCGERSFGGEAYFESIITSEVWTTISVRDYSTMLPIEGLIGNDFEIFVDGSTLGETTIDAVPLLNPALYPVPFIDIDTHILVDVSSSISEPELNIIKNAIKNMLYKNSVSQLFSDQEVSLSSFSGLGTFNVEQALTTDAALLSTAVDNLARGATSTAMVESVTNQLVVMQPLNLGSGMIDYPHMILITDGAETAQPSISFDKTVSGQREIFIVALDVSESDPEYEKLKQFDDLGDGRLIFTTTYSGLESTLNQIQNILSKIPYSFYWTAAALPMRDDTTHVVDRKIKDNQVDFKFFSDIDVTGFTDTVPLVTVDGRKNAGLNSVTLFTTTFFDGDPNNYSWQLVSGPATIESLSADTSTAVVLFSSAGTAQIQIDDLNNGQSLTFNVDDTGAIF